MAAYRFNDVANGLYHHVWHTFCDWYVELSKPLLQDGDEATKAETRTTAAWALDQCLILLSPVMPFITEELWQVTGGDGVLMHKDWPVYTAADYVDEDAAAEMRWTISLIEAIRSVRAEMNVPARRADSAAADEFRHGDRAAPVASGGAVIRRLARLSEAAVGDTAPEGSIVTSVEGATVNLPLADVIDVKAESARLKKSLGKLEKGNQGPDRQARQRGVSRQGSRDGGCRTARASFGGRVGKGQAERCAGAARSVEITRPQDVASEALRPIVSERGTAR